MPRSPLEVRNALVYVYNNDLRHRNQRNGHRFDWFSSAPLFDGWREGPLAWPWRWTGPPPAAPSRSWLLTVSWRRHGLLSTDEVPRGA